MMDSTLTPPDPAREEFEKALRLARACKLQKDFWGAFAEAQKACELDSRNLEAQELAGELALQLKLWDEAIFHLDIAQYLDPQNEKRAARLEKIREDALLFTRPVTEIMAEAREGQESWRAVFKSVFLRPDPIWYQSGWFHSILAFAGLLLFMVAFKWVITTGPWFFLAALLHLGMVAWMAYDSHVHGEPAIFWGIVGMFGSLFGFALYLTVRGMSSGIGHDGGSRFFSG